MRVLITGINGQVGQAISKSLTKNKHSVVGIDARGKEPELTSKTYVADICDSKKIEEVYNKEENFDVLINNAGQGVYTPTLERTIEEYRKVVDTNIYGTIAMTNGFIRRNGNNGGKIINIASIYGHISSDYRIYGESGRNNSEVYAASKAGVIQLTKYYAANFSHMGYQCLSISPGGIYNGQERNFVKNYIEKCPINRMADVGEVAALVSLLIDAPAYLNGEDIKIDGGFTAW